ncbi:hypothetical protein FA13DRAFT_1712007 [Coprinellus micaceus]|uniref:Uncharacterized protein n=1 Tax=Coprinellus micaceus TaxID=71717 RepID=A0A4Y7T222_COPMI|nr:hypothetical protein FA13DRAFT_1712007 [Coprinellus micaceus]
MTYDQYKYPCEDSLNRKFKPFNRLKHSRASGLNKTRRGQDVVLIPEHAGVYIRMAWAPKRPGTTATLDIFYQRPKRETPKALSTDHGPTTLDSTSSVDYSSLPLRKPATQRHKHKHKHKPITPKATAAAVTASPSALANNFTDTLRLDHGNPISITFHQFLMPPDARQHIVLPSVLRQGRKELGGIFRHFDISQLSRLNIPQTNASGSSSSGGSGQ